jgi:hypothetical protein
MTTRSRNLLIARPRNKGRKQAGTAKPGSPAGIAPEPLPASHPVLVHRLASLLHACSEISSRGSLAAFRYHFTFS